MLMKQGLFKKAFSALVVTLGLGAGAWAAVQQVNDAANASTKKFHVDVTGYALANADGTRTPVAVKADVYGDYHFVVTMPVADNSTVGADKATVNVSMTGVKTLGLKDGETRSYSKTVETGVQSVSASLATALSNVYGFKGATIPVTVKDGAETAQFDYQIGAFNNNQIVGTPSNEALARDAWHLITSNVSASQNLKDNDTHFLFKRGAYILIGDEKLVFDQDYDFLKGNANLSTLFSDVRPYVHVEKSGLSGQAANKAVVYFPEGSTLGISSSAAVLNKDAFLTVDATDKTSLNITGQLSGLRDQLAKSGDGATKVAIYYAVDAFNQIIGLVDEAENVPVTLEFKKNKFHVDVTGYSSDDANAVPVTVNADVYSDYSFDVSLPAAGSDQLTASKATVNLRMSDVSSLGVKGTRSYSKTVETGVSGVSVPLSGALKNTYAFSGASCPVTIKADGQEKSFTYNIAGIKDDHIVGTPSNSANAQAAWQLMTSKVKAAQGSVDDTHFLFKKGAYLQIGDERLVFLNDFDFLKGTASEANLFDGANVRIEKANVADANSAKAVVYLPAGSTLGVSQSNASVTEDVKVTVDGTASQATVKGFFTSRKGQATNAKAAIATAISYFDQIVGMVDHLNGVSFTVEFTKPAETPKFHLDVTGYDATTHAPIAVNADVYGDYHFVVALPDPLNDNLSTSKATVNIAMTGVESLGLKAGETRSYSKTLETGLTGGSAKLSAFLNNTYKFNGVKCPVTIKDDTGSKSFTYNIAGINEDYQIVGTPSSTEEARAAWKFMTSHVKTSQDLSTNDTHFLFKKGAYLQIGDEKLVFDTDYDFLKGSANLDDLFNGIRPAVHVEKDNLTGPDLKTASVYLPAGSTLFVSSSNATVDQNVTVTMNASQSQADESYFKGLLSGYRDKVYSNGSVNKQTAIALLVYYFDQVVGLVDNAEKVSFTVEFTNNGDVQYKKASTDGWKVAYTDADGYYNINGDNLYAFRVNNNVADAKINFTRNFKEGIWAAWVAPFDLTLSQDILDNYEFGYLEGTINPKDRNDIDKDKLEGVVITIKKLKAGDVVKANLPYVVYPKTAGSKTFTVQGTLKKTESRSTQITGNAYIYKSTGIYETRTYATSDDTWYALTKGMFLKAGTDASLRPFRFYFTVTDNSSNPYAPSAKPAYIKLVFDDGLATGINGIETEKNNGKKVIYDLQGRRVYNPTQKGVYIVNGRKVVLGK